MTLSTSSAVKILWGYLILNHQLAPASGIVALGSNDREVADRAAEIFFEGHAPFIVCSGRWGSRSFCTSRSEAELFAERIEAKGVPHEKVLLECRSTNTYENIAYTRALLEEEGIVPRSLIVVTKPFVERRCLAICLKIWPEVRWTVTSPRTCLREYQKRQGDLPHHLVGTVQRLVLYAERGFQIRQTIPGEVLAAYELLRREGYTQQLVEEDERAIERYQSSPRG